MNTNPMKNLLTNRIELSESTNTSVQVTSAVTMEFCYDHVKEDDNAISNAPIVYECESSNTILS